MSADNRSPLARVGLISDTHGKVDARVHDAFAGVDAIIHAGDICEASVVDELYALSPALTAVLGNCDLDDYGCGLGLQARTTIAGVRFLVIHDIHRLGPIPEDVDVVVHGHSHQPSIQYHGRVLVVNPGSASQRRRMPSRSVGVVEIWPEDRLEAHIVQLDDVGEVPSST